MFVKIRSTSTLQTIVIEISKAATIRQLKLTIEPHLSLPPERQRLFYAGKQLHDDTTLCDNKVQDGYTIQLTEQIDKKDDETPKVKEEPQETDGASSNNSSLSDEVKSLKEVKEELEKEVKEDSFESFLEREGQNSRVLRKDTYEFVNATDFFKRGEYVDVLDSKNGSWIQGEIFNISKIPDPPLDQSSALSVCSFLSSVDMSSTENSSEASSEPEDQSQNDFDDKKENKLSNGPSIDHSSENDELIIVDDVSMSSSNTNTTNESEDRRIERKKREIRSSLRKFLRGEAEPLPNEDSSCKLRKVVDSSTLTELELSRKVVDSSTLTELELSMSMVVHPSMADQSTASTNSSTASSDIHDSTSGYKYLYIIKYLIKHENPILDYTEAESTNLLPVARVRVPVDQLKVGDRILANFNIDDKYRIGLWYECSVVEIKRNRRGLSVIVDIKVGEVWMHNIQLQMTKEIYKFEEQKLLADREPVDMTEPPERGSDLEDICKACKNNKPKCKDCGCRICHGREDGAKQIGCDECDCFFHIWCLNPPLADVPDEDEWYCPECKTDVEEIVGAGKTLKESKKRAKMPSKVNNTKRDWGKGMATAGRTKECTIVPSNHYGPIPNVEVGSSWFYRTQCSESGVHRPLVSGIHGKAKEGAYSIVLSGGYEDDEDMGDTVIYTGAGGRDLSGNKRTSVQNHDQEFTGTNKALALNCNARFNPEGAESKDWKKGKPVRLVRNAKAAKHSKFAPEEGNRYDGIYKVKSYRRIQGQSGFKICQFTLVRDDPIPAPWTKEGKARIEKLGLVMEYPENYWEAKAAKEAAKNLEEPGTSKDGNGKGKKGKKNEKGVKRTIAECLTQQGNAKRPKVPPYEIEDDVKAAIDKDKVNENKWKDCVAEAVNGRKKFMDDVESKFSCICCTDLVYQPITTKCGHDFCKACLTRAFKSGLDTCPTCRASLDTKTALNEINQNLQDVLNLLFKGYGNSR